MLTRSDNAARSSRSGASDSEARGPRSMSPHVLRPSMSSSRSHRYRLVLTALIGVGLVWVAIAFAGFVRDVNALAAPASVSAGGIVVVTGGADRIEVALQLLQDGAAERLLISGVHDATDAHVLAARTKVDASVFACCVDLGYAALDTAGNAREAAAWAHTHGFTSLVVVTSAYHIPRTTYEMANHLPDVTLVPFPVDPATDSRLADASATTQWPLKLMAREFIKLHVAQLRHLVGGAV